MRPKLAISLNASSDEQRDKIMPINRKYPLEKLLEACRKYPLRPWEHLTFEYVLLGGFNDSPEDAPPRGQTARELARQGESDSVESRRLPVREAGAERRVSEFQGGCSSDKGVPHSCAIRAGRT